MMNQAEKIAEYNKLPTYEIILPFSFNEVDFTQRAERGEGKLWLVCIDNDMGVRRYKGVLMGQNVRIFVDIFHFHQKATRKQKIMFVTTPIYQNLNPYEVAKIVFEYVKGIKMYHEGKEVEV